MRSPNDRDQQIKAVFFDIDRTLLSHTDGRKQVPDSARRSLMALHEKGVRLFIATGRHVTELGGLPLAGLPFDGYVTLNGQLCLDSHFSPVYKSPLPAGEAGLIVKMFNEKAFPVLLVEEKEMYLNRSDMGVQQVHRAVSSPLPPVKAYTGHEVYMAAVFLPDGARELRGRFPTLRFVRWHAYAADILPADGGKSVGMQAMMDLYGISKEEVMAFGDEENDIDMLTYAGIGVAMGNAGEAVRAAADYVTDHIDKDGIAKALQYFGLL